MILERKITAELPFSLNLPEGSYDVNLENTTISLLLLQNRIALAIGNEAKQTGWRFYTAEQAIEKAKSAEWPVAQIELHTIVECSFTQEINDPGEGHRDWPEAQDEMVRALLTSDEAQGLAGEALTALATQRLTESSDEHAASLARIGRIRKLLKYHYDENIGAIAVFYEAVNHLLKHYMVVFNDRFVEEITVHHLQLRLANGPLVRDYADGQLIQDYPYSLYVPFFQSGPWFKHPEEETERFQKSLASGSDADPVQLLLVRARSLHMRGAFRSAVLEASGAFEVSVRLACIHGLRQQGINDATIDNHLVKQWKLEDRCKKLMERACGFRVPDLDIDLWQRFLQLRDKTRNTVAHTEHEPTDEDAEEIIKVCGALSQLVMQQLKQ